MERSYDARVDYSPGAADSTGESAHKGHRRTATNSTGLFCGRMISAASSMKLWMFPMPMPWAGYSARWCPRRAGPGYAWGMMGGFPPPTWNGP